MDYLWPIIRDAAQPEPHPLPQAPKVSLTRRVRPADGRLSAEEAAAVLGVSKSTFRGAATSEAAAEAASKVMQSGGTLGGTQLGRTAESPSDNT